jgi:hypothetical protein
MEREEGRFARKYRMKRINRVSFSVPTVAGVRFGIVAGNALGLVMAGSIAHLRESANPASPAKTGELKIFCAPLKEMQFFASLRETFRISRKDAKAAKGLASPPQSV